MTSHKTRLLAGAAIALASAIPAAAQEGLCGGVGASGQWIGGSEGASDVSTATSAMEQMALVLMRNEYVALFTVSAGTDVRVEAEGRGAGDPVIDLRDAAGNIILSDDDSGGNGASRGEMFLAPGSYCLSMKSYDGAPMTGFVRVGRLEHEPLTAGLGGEGGGGADPIDMPFFGDDGACVMANVRDFLGDGPIDGSLSTGGASVTASVNQVRYWGFALASPSSISITAENPSADPIITLYDGFGNFIDENDDFDGLNSRIDVTYPLDAGQYCIEVAAYSDDNQPITLTVMGYDANAATAGMYDRGEMSPPLDGSHAVTALGTLGTRLRQDVQATERATWFSVDIDVAGLILIEAISNGQGDPVLVMFDDFGRQVAYNDDYGSGLDSLITARVMPGTYLVAVRHLGSGQSGLIRMLFERYVPAQ